MNFINIDPNLGQMLTQLIHLKNQVEQVKSVDTSQFISAIAEFSNLLGVEMANQATGKSSWVNPNTVPSQTPHIDLSASVLEQTVSQGD